jgi:hypothetical protein
VIGGTYYACDGNGCRSISLPLAKQVSNPVGSFAHDNNGVLVVLPAVGASGATTLSGSLIFGIGTQGNNVLNSETVYGADSGGDFITTYNGTKYVQSYLDSGSNAYFFDDKTIQACTLSKGFYCPASPLNLTAVNSSADGRTSATVNFTVVSVDGLAGGITAGNIGGSISDFSSSTGVSKNETFDWGLPFFFGRRVFVAIQNANTPYGNGPSWAY